MVAVRGRLCEFRKSIAALLEGGSGGDTVKSFQWDTKEDREYVRGGDKENPGRFSKAPGSGGRAEKEDQPTKKEPEKPKAKPTPGGKESVTKIEPRSDKPREQPAKPQLDSLANTKAEDKVAAAAKKQFDMYYGIIAGKLDATSPRVKVDMEERRNVAQSLAHQPLTIDVEMEGGTFKAHHIVTEDEKWGVFKSGANEFRSDTSKSPVRKGVQEGTFFRREVAASRVADALGMADLVPVTAFRKEKGELGSAQHFIEGAENAWGSKNPWDGKPDMERAAAFDYLIGNLDRHMGNWMTKDVGGHKKLGLIDNGLAFPSSYHDEDAGNQYILAKAHEDGLTVPQLPKDAWPVIEIGLRESGLDKEAIGLTKERYDALAASAGKKFSDLPGLAPGAKTVGDMVDGFVRPNIQRRAEAKMAKAKTMRWSTKNYRGSIKTKDDEGHEHAPAGSSEGGRFVAKGGGSGRVEGHEASGEIKIGDEVWKPIIRDGKKMWRNQYSDVTTKKPKPPKEASKPPTEEKKTESSPAKDEKAPPVGSSELHASMKDSWERLTLFREFSNGLVEMPRLYKEVKKKQPGLTVDDFKKELQLLWDKKEVELHILNEVREAKDPDQAIKSGNKLYYFVYWKPKEKAK
jgi:hypothetical protein